MMHRRGVFRLTYNLKSTRRLPRTLFIFCLCLLSMLVYARTLPSQELETEHKIKQTDSKETEIKDKLKNPRQCLPVERNFLRPNLDLRIIIVANDKPKSLLRLLKSLNKVVYGRHKVAIEIWLDRNHTREYSAETVRMALNFVFDYGPCDIHINNQHEGKTGQWFYTWRTYNNTKEIAVILEDYLTVSPYFFSWLKLVHSLYGERSDVSGFALQGKQIRHSDSVCCLNISIQHKVFLYSMFGVSGFSPNNKQWLQYIAWSPEHTLKMRGLPVKKSRHVTAGQKYDQLRLAMEYIQYTWRNKQFTLYPNFKGNKGLAYSWNDGESDSDFKGEGNGTDTDGLLLEWTTDYENLPAIPVYVNTTGVIIKTQVPMK